MESKISVPAAIVLAGVIIAGAILYSRMPASPPAGGANPAGNPSQAPGAGINASEAFKIREGDFVLGSSAAKVVLVEYGDFQCPFCGRFFQTVEKELKETYIKQGKAALVWRDFAFLGAESFKAAEAARCAGEQGKFWDYHDKLFLSQNGENQGAFADANLKKFARDLGLDSMKFDLCLASGKYRKAVEEASQEGKTVGVSGTPTTFVNGRVVSGAVPFATFKQLIEEELKK